MGLQTDDKKSTIIYNYNVHDLKPTLALRMDFCTKNVRKYEIQAK